MNSELFMLLTVESAVFVGYSAAHHLYKLTVFSISHYHHVIRRAGFLRRSEPV